LQLAPSIDEQPRPVSHWKLVHVTASQEAPSLQPTSQPHEPLQSTPRHDCDPLQVTSHLPLPQSIMRHAPVPLHVTLQVLLLLGGQVTPERQLFATVHATSQFQPGGQTTAWLQLVTAQSILQVCVPWLQLVHCAGHVFIDMSPGGPSVIGGPSDFGASTVPPGTTQKPPVQTRPFSQSDCVWHSNSPLL
jgi:hypothetical protein